MVKITNVECGSYAESAGILSGDLLISLNSNEIRDVLDYRFYLAEKKLKLRLVREGREYAVKIKKGEYDDIGLSFESALMDKKQLCKNGCIFCFIDQNPKGMRESIYFKDDDSRLSFIHGNYITLTNMTDKDISRIVKMRFSPINISVHTTNPELRVKMMKNKRSGEVLEYLSRFKRAGLSMCAQIVLCKGINDGDELLRSMRDLSAFFPELGSVSVVPAGLTKFREGLYPISDFSKEEAAAVIDMVDSFANQHKASTGSRLFFAADEFYLKAERELPRSEYYEDYPQLENGVGMIRSFSDEFDAAAADAEITERAEKRTVTVVTGVASYPLISSLAEQAMRLDKGLCVRVVRVVNKFFGESITVSGLLTGTDILSSLTGQPLGDEVLIPPNSLRYPEEDFLCGMTLTELQDKLGVPVRISGEDGFSFLDTLLGKEVL